MASFQQELTELINKHSFENGSGTPDFVLAAYIMEVMAAFNKACNERRKWYDANPTTVPVDD